MSGNHTANVLSLFLVGVSVVISGCQGPKANKVDEPIFWEHSRLEVGSQVRTFRSSTDFSERFRVIGGPQGEYETDAAFEQRIGQFGAFKVYAPVEKQNLKFDKNTGSITVILSSTGSSELVPLHDDVPTRKDLRKFGYLNSDVTVFLGQQDTILGSYEGQNAYGAKAQVVEGRVETMALRFGTVYKATSAIQDNWYFTRAVSLPPEEIPNQLADLRFEITGALIPPFLKKKVFFSSPTISHPASVAHSTSYFFAEVAEINLVNIKTGATLARDLQPKLFPRTRY